MPHQMYFKILILAAVTAVVFFNSLGNGFVYDDELLITGQAQYLSDFNNLFSTTVSMVFQDKRVSAFYRPVLMMTYFIDYRLGGGNAFSFHLTNILIHLANVILVFYLVFLLFGDRLLAFFSGLVFAVHPVQSEAVAWVSGRNDPLMLLFLLLAFLAFVFYRRRPNAVAAAGLIFFFFLALMTKETAAIFPFAFAGYHLLRRDEKFDFWPYLWLAGVIVVYLAVRLLIFKGGAFAGGQLGFMLLPQLFGYYFKILFLPGGFSIIPHIKTELGAFEYLLRSLPFICFLAALAICRRRAPQAAFGLWWGFIALLPVSGLIMMPVLAMEHRLYAAMFGFSLVAGWLVKSGFDAVKRVGLKISLSLIFILLLAWYGRLTVERNRAFHDPLTLWKISVRNNPFSEQIHGNLGAAYIDNKEYAAGEKEVLTALRMAPENPVNHYNLGYLYLITGREREGIKEMARAAELDPKYVKAHYNLGIWALNHGDKQAAIREMELILRLNPRFEQARMMLEKLKVK